MPQISLTDFKATQEAAERQKRMAAALREQSTSPIQIQSYNGIQAPIPWTEVLAKALAGYAAGRKERKADESITEGRATARREAMDFVRGLKQETPQDRFIAPPNFQPEQPGFIDRLKQAGQQFMPQQPQPMSDPQGPPPQMQPPAGAPMVPAQPMAMPQATQPQDPYSGNEGPMDASQLRQIPAELQNRARSPEEQQQMLMGAAMSGNPYLESIAPKMYADLESSMQTQAERDRKIEAIIGMDATDDQKRQMIAAMDLGDNEAFKNAIKPPVPIQSPEGVIGLIVQKVAAGQEVTPQEREVYNLWASKMRKQGQWAPVAPKAGPRPDKNAPRAPTLEEIDAAILAAGG
jgi:hypothetical protein